MGLKYCPLTGGYCKSVRCAWWTKHYDGCVIPEMSGSLHSILNSLYEINERQEQQEDEDATN